LIQATKLDPNNAGFQEWLGDLYSELYQSDKAISCFERALAVRSEDRPSLHLSLGQALLDEGRLVEAENHYHIALSHQTEPALAHVYLGDLHAVRGGMAEAETAFRQALHLQPSLPPAHARLAILLGGDLPDADLAALEKRPADPELDPWARGRLLFGLAHVLDARCDYSRAAQCSREANALMLERARAWLSHAPMQQDAFIESLTMAFDLEFFERARGLGLETDRPVFVFGLPRSGTTLIEQVLSSHSHVHGAGELRLAQRSFEAIPDVLARRDSPLNCVAYLDITAVQRLADQYLSGLPLSGSRADRVVDKMPGNYMHLGLLATLFPNATFIHCRRDLRDVALSCWITDFRVVPWATDIDHIAARFRQYRRLMDHWRMVLPVVIHEVAYEETVDDLESVARRLVGACGLQWEPACLEFYRTQRPVRTASMTQVRKPIYRGSVGRWKNYEAEFADLFAKLQLDQGLAQSPQEGTREPMELAAAV